MTINPEEMAARLAVLDALLRIQHERLDQITEEARVLREAIVQAKADFTAAKLRGNRLAERNSKARSSLR